MTDQRRAVAEPSANADAADAAASGPFVINLSSSTTPMALEQPRSAELARFTFFVSRRREEGRERFRLHMGYFETIEEAEEWLTVVRDIFPAAWVGEAPGKRLRTEQAARAAKPPAVPAVAARPVPAPAPAAGASTAPAPAAPAPAACAPVARAAAPAPAPKPAPLPKVSRAAAPAAASPPRRVVPTLKPANPLQQSNVREVLARLDEPSGDPLTDTQVLKLLEGRRNDVGPETARAPARPSEADTAISMLRPEDTQTMRALKAEVAQNSAVAFAVQLQWSVQPIEVAKVPPLAIFSAYTLYTVEGSREGRRWYGLRLGFFSDAISAKQVAYYVRSEFASVAVIPVTAKERERAGDRSQSRRLQQPPQPKPAKAADEIKLFDDDAPRPLAAETAPKSAAATPPQAGGQPGAEGPVSLRRKRRSGARPHSAPQSLDETLEILGAGELEIDRSHTLLNDTGVRHLRIEPDNRPPSAFSRLLDRLADRLRQS